MTSSDEKITETQQWSVRLKDMGKEVLRSLGGNSQLCDWSFIVDVPAQKGRTEAELVEQIRSLGTVKIHQECQRDGLNISIEDLSQNNSFECLDSSKR